MKATPTTSTTSTTSQPTNSQALRFQHFLLRDPFNISSSIFSASALTHAHSLSFSLSHTLSLYLYLYNNTLHHVNALKESLEDAFNLNPEIRGDSRKIWSMSEAKVDPDHGKKVKKHADSMPHHGGFVRGGIGSGSGVHATAIIAGSASGLKSSPVFYCERKESHEIRAGPFAGKLLSRQRWQTSCSSGSWMGRFAARRMDQM